MFFLAALVLSGCSETCALPQSELNEKVWSVFVQPVSYTLDGEGFPAESSPGNGSHRMSIDWSSQEPEAPVVVTIDGQPFDGTGKWATEECGNFSIGFAGLYTGVDGATHAFGAGARLMTWPDHLDGFLDWTETWENADGGGGSYTAEAQMFGSPEAGGADTGDR